MTEIEGVEDVQETPLGSISGFRELDPMDSGDDEFVIEGSPEAAEVVTPQPAEAGQSAEDIKAQLEALKAQMAQAQGVQGLQKTLEDTLKKIQMPVVPQYQVPQQPQETPEQRKQRLQRLYIEDPVKASEEMNRENSMAMVQMMINGYEKLSKETIMVDPAAKATYQKYSQEVEDEVQRMPPMEKAQNPRIYQTALERVKARHTEDILAEQIQAGVKAALQQMGLDPDKPTTPVARGGPTVPSMATRPGGQTPPKPKNTVIIPRWVSEEAERQGLSAKFYYQHLKSTGRIK